MKTIILLAKLYGIFSMGWVESVIFQVMVVVCRFIVNFCFYGSPIVQNYFDI